MIYAKLDDQGNVTEFPYRDRSVERLSPNDDLPEGVVRVDIETNRPNVTWEQIYHFDTVTKTGDNYIASFTVSDRFKNDEDKLRGIKDLVLIRSKQNERRFVHLSNELTKKYPDSEVKSWGQQRIEAEAYLNDDNANVPLLTTIAAARGIELDDLAIKVISNVNEYDSTFGTLLGKYQKNRTLLAAIDLDDGTTWNNIDQLEDI